MLSDLGRRDRRYHDPATPMAGRCLTCKTIIECRLSDTARIKGPANLPDPALWTDLQSAECPNCGARVFVMEKKDFAGVVASPLVQKELPRG